MGDSDSYWEVRMKIKAYRMAIAAAALAAFLQALGAPMKWG